MKYQKTGWRKGLAVFMTAVMAMGLVPVVPGSMNYVQAAERVSEGVSNDVVEVNESTPSVTVFATKSELMTVFDLDGSKDSGAKETNDVVGKIVFGRTPVTTEAPVTTEIPATTDVSSSTEIAATTEVSSSTEIAATVDTSVSEEVGTQAQTSATTASGNAITESNGADEGQESVDVANEESASDIVEYIPQEWYIAGKDSGIEGDNVVLFATCPMLSRQQYKGSETNYSYEAPTGNKKVYSNHYGASNARALLNSMLDNTEKYFSSAEQQLMNDTTITTIDKRNDLEYRLTDKLYLATYVSKDNHYIHIGSGDQLAINCKHWTNKWIWLRSPARYDTTVCSTKVDQSGNWYVQSNGTKDLGGIQPAFNLNLTNILFASSAVSNSTGSSESGTIEAGTAMTLRLDGKEQEALTAATVQYNHNTIEYKAASGATLMIQGKVTIDGTETEWYYSVPVTDSNETIMLTADAIQTGANLAYTPNLNNCEIWLETTGANGMIYAIIGEDSLPDVTKFATKKELMTAFSMEGRQDTIGKI